jgi:Spy/CpxP family protein refolding chaperone
MKSKNRNLLIGAAIAAAIGATGVAVADMGGAGGNCPQGMPMQQGMMGHGQHGRMGQGSGQMMGGMMGGMQDQGSGGMMGRRMGRMMGDMQGGMAEMLELTSEQRAEMGKLRQQFLPKMGELRGRMQATHEQLHALMQGGGTDQAAIGELADQKGDLMAEMIKLRAANHAQMQALLTDEQRERMQQHRQGMGGGMMGTPPADG